MAIAIILTDTHLSPNTIDVNKSIYSQVIQEAQKLGLDTVYHAGDIFDSRKAQPLSVLQTFIEILDMFHESGIKLTAIPGNHDKNDYKSERSYLDPFQHHPAFELVSTQKIVKVNSKFKIALIPFFNESDTYSSYLTSTNGYIQKNDRCFLITHIAVNGVKNNDGSKVDNHITKEMFSKYENVLIGHYHNQSVVHKNITYIGSAYQQNYGEDNKKGFCVIDDNGELYYIKSKFPEFKKVTVDLNSVTLIEAENLIKVHKTENDNVRFIFKGTYEQVNAIDKNLFKKQGVDVKLESSEIEVGVEQAENNEFVSFDKTGITEEFETFCQINSIENSEIGKKYLSQTLNKQ